MKIPGPAAAALVLVLGGTVAPGDLFADSVKKSPLTGHVTNYDESKVGTYTLPDPLVLADGRKVTNADIWYHERRPELLEIYRRDIYGRVPARAPAVRFEDAGSAPALGGAAIRKVVIAHFGPGADGPIQHLVIYLPAHAAGPLPVLFHLTFMGDPPVRVRPGWPPMAEEGPIATILQRGYAYAVVRYIEPQPDDAKTHASGIEALAATPGADRAPDEWGTIGVWAWAASRMLDYFRSNPQFDGTRVALIGHSRLGKTALWAGAQDPRFALVFSSCAGEMGSSLARRDFGETVDDMAGNFPWQFAKNFQRYIGHWNDLPIDTHMMIALNAPHPVMITGGSLDLWADPHGEFLAEVAAGPVYRLVGRTGLSSETMPGLNQGVMGGDLAFRYHQGRHAIMPEDWTAFLDYADRYLHPTPTR